MKICPETITIFQSIEILSCSHCNSAWIFQIQSVIKDVIIKLPNFDKLIALHVKDVCFDQASDASFQCTRYQSSNSGRTVPPFSKAVYWFAVSGGQH